MDTSKAVAKPRNFDQMLEAWAKATTASRDLAVEIANYAISHLYEHGQIAFLQKFLTALETTGKNYVRKAAYLLWLKAYAPIKMESGVLVVDKSKEFDPELLKKALKVKFFDFAPEKEKIFFEADGVVVPIARAIANFDRDNMIPKDENAVKAVELARQACAVLKRQIALLEPTSIVTGVTGSEIELSDDEIKKAVEAVAAPAASAAA